MAGKTTLYQLIVLTTDEGGNTVAIDPDDVLEPNRTFASLAGAKAAAQQLTDDDIAGLDLDEDEPPLKWLHYDASPNRWEAESVEACFIFLIYAIELEG